MPNPLPSLVHPWETEDVFARVCETTILGDVANPSNAEILEWPRGNETTLRYIYWMHHSENIPHVLPAIVGTDVLAIEAPGADDAEMADNSKRQREMQETSANIEALENFICGAELKEEELVRLNRMYQGHIPELNPNQAWQTLVHIFGADNDLTHLLSPFIGSGTRVVSLENSYFKAGELYDLNQKAKESQERSRSALTVGASYAELEKRVLAEVLVGAQVMDAREFLAKEQINDLVQEHPGKRISVLYGCMHHLLSRMVEAESVGMQRYVAPSMPNPEVTRANINRMPLYIAEATVRSRGGEISLEVLEELVISHIADLALRGDARHAFYRRKLYKDSGLRSQIKDVWQEDLGDDSVAVLRRLHVTTEILVRVLY